MADKRVSSIFSGEMDETWESQYDFGINDEGDEIGPMRPLALWPTTSNYEDIADEIFSDTGLLPTPNVVEEYSAEEYHVGTCWNVTTIPEMQTKQEEVPLPRSSSNEKVPEVEKYSCDICGKSYKTIPILRNHLPSHTKNPFICEICGKPYKYRASLDYHLRKHKGKVYTCEICGKSFQHYCTFQDHLEKHAGTEFKCKHCPKSFKASTPLKKHVRLVHLSQPPMACPICCLKLKRKKFWREHIKRKHPEKWAVMLTCHSCSNVFEKENILENHLKVEHDVMTPLKCPICDQINQSPDDLTWHVNESHFSDDKADEFLGYIAAKRAKTARK